MKEKNNKVQLKLYVHPETRELLRRQAETETKETDKHVSMSVIVEELVLGMGEPA